MLGLVKAIDETVWFDIIFNGPITKQKNSNWFDEIDMHSPYLDFSSNLIKCDKELGEPVVISPIYQVAKTLASNAYFFASDDLVIYVTGLTPALTAVIRIAFKNCMTLTLMHYDNASGEYIEDVMFSQNDVCHDIEYPAWVACP